MNATALNHRIDNLTNQAVRLIRQAADPAEVPEQRTVDIFLGHAIDALQAVRNLHRGKPVCPGCNGLGLRRAYAARILDCERCGGIFTNEPILPIEVVKLISGDMLDNAGPAGSFYFDLQVASDDGRTQRFHGWADKATKRVVQWG